MKRKIASLLLASILIVSMSSFSFAHGHGSNRVKWNKCANTECSSLELYSKYVDDGIFTESEIVSILGSISKVDVLAECMTNKKMTQSQYDELLLHLEHYSEYHHNKTCVSQNHVSYKYKEHH